jgi:hypothetical protein
MQTAQLREATAQLSKSSPSHIIAGTKKWAQNERFSTAMLITHLAEVAAQKIFIDRSATMFSYCTDVLGLEPGCVWLRLQVANCCRRFPELLDELVAGTLGLSVAALLAPHLTPENHTSLIAKSRHKPKRVVEEMLADLNPKEPAKPGIRAHPSSARAPLFSTEAVNSISPESSFQAMTPPAGSSNSVAPESSFQTMTPPVEGGGKAKIVPLGNKRYYLKFSYDAAQKPNLERLGELLGITAYGPHLATLVERALDIALKA